MRFSIYEHNGLYYMESGGLWEKFCDPYDCTYELANIIAGRTEMQMVKGVERKVEKLKPKMCALVEVGNNKKVYIRFVRKDMEEYINQLACLSQTDGKTGTSP